MFTLFKTASIYFKTKITITSKMKLLQPISAQFVRKILVRDILYSLDLSHCSPHKSIYTAQRMDAAKQVEKQRTTE